MVQSESPSNSGLDRIRLAVIGCGSISQAQHLLAIRQTNQFQLVALVDPDPDNARRAAARWHTFLPGGNADACPEDHPLVDGLLNRVYFKDHQSMIAAKVADAVLIATPNDSHRHIAFDCLAAGLHILCEKPAALDISGHEELMEISAEKDLVFQIGMVFRYSDVYRYARELLDDPEFGEPKMMVSHEFRPFPIQPWRTSKRVSGGIFIEACGHHFDLFNWMVRSSAKAARVFAMAGQAVLRDTPKEVWSLREKITLPGSDVPDHTWVTIEYENGITAQLGLSHFVPWGRENRMGLVGSEWKIDIYEMHRLIYIQKDRTGIHQKFPPDPTGTRWQAGRPDPEKDFVQSGAVRQWEEFARSIRDGIGPFCGLEESMESVRIAVAAERSAAFGRMVDLTREA